MIRALPVLDQLRDLSQALNEFEEKEAVTRWQSLRKINASKCRGSP
jgi:hypothetical protein